MVKKFDLNHSLLNHVRTNNIVGWVEEGELYKEDYYEIFAFFAANPNISDETKKLANGLYTWYTELSNNEPFLEKFVDEITAKLSSVLDKVFYDELILLIHNIHDMIIRWSKTPRSKFLSNALYDYLEVVDKNYVFDWNVQFFSNISSDELLVDVYNLYNEYKKIISKYNKELEKKIIVNKQNITFKKRTTKARIS